MLCFTLGVNPNHRIKHLDMIIIFIIFGMIISNTEVKMRTAKIAITMDKSLLLELDSLVAKNTFPNRSQAIQSAVKEHLDRIKRNRLAIESAKLNQNEEQSLADEGMDMMEDEWAEY